MKPSPFDRAVARRLAKALREERAKRKLSDDKVQTLTQQLEGIHLTMTSAMGNLTKADKSFLRLMSHFKEDI